MIHSVFNQLFVKIPFIKIRPKKVVLFPETGRVKFCLSLTRLHSQMCIRIYIFNLKKQASKKIAKQSNNTKKTNKQKNSKTKQ